ncbi:glycoside hydrolase family 16 protein [Glaciihabitans sp. dw_435]|uniref:glycoside hydrolase family 16 protein n=1 Tax=Glaciihabitans sp. dw_435 TaxID=2720081 RepID=UPI0027DC2151|nr:glycoside hydrolase family 16 protein [Glaciihabitans sp. dw_435]
MLAAILVAGAVATSASITLTAAPAESTAQSWGEKQPLLWEDTFSGPAGTGLSSRAWTLVSGNAATSGWGNHELEYYTPSASKRTGWGTLQITARRSSDPTLLCWTGQPCPYTSARLTTEGKVSLLYGRAEARIKIPVGAGLWPAFWMLGSGTDWPNTGEIDVMERIGREPTTVYGTAHGPGYSGGNGLSSHTTVGSASTGDGAWHTYAIDKQPGSVTWYIDGRQYFSITRASLPPGTAWVFDRPFYLLLNLAVGGDWPGSPTASTAFPAVMSVDYVRLRGTGWAPK